MPQIDCSYATEATRPVTTGAETLQGYVQQDMLHCNRLAPECDLWYHCCGPERLSIEDGFLVFTA